MQLTIVLRRTHTDYVIKTIEVPQMTEEDEVAALELFRDGKGLGRAWVESVNAERRLPRCFKLAVKYEDQHVQDGTAPKEDQSGR